MSKKQECAELDRSKVVRDLKQTVGQGRGDHLSLAVGDQTE